MSRYRKLLSLPTTALVALLLLAACQATGGPAAQPASDASSTGSSSGQAAQSGDTPAKVRLAFLYDVHAAGLWTVPDCLRPRNVDVEMLSFKQFAEAQRAFETGQADFAGMGYQNLAQMGDHQQLTAVEEPRRGGQADHRPAPPDPLGRRERLHQPGLAHIYVVESVEQGTRQPAALHQPSAPALAAVVVGFPDHKRAAAWCLGVGREIAG